VTDLLALQPAFDGLPHDRREQAFEWAAAALPVAALINHLGYATAQLATVNAAAHWLARQGVPDLSDATLDTRPSGHAATSPKAEGQWAGSPYGDTVAAILARLPRASGRGRRLPLSV
jgi:hypothetical protein